MNFGKRLTSLNSLPSLTEIQQILEANQWDQITFHEAVQPQKRSSLNIPEEKHVNPA